MKSSIILTSILLIQVTVLGAEIFGPICGNGVVEGNEECEVLGANCLDNCTCSPGTNPTIPKSTNCLGANSFDLGKALLCPSANATPSFTCIPGIETEFLQCQDSVLSFKPCPSGTVCTSSGVFRANPCSIPRTNFSRCGNDIVEPGESCDGGPFCDDCRCVSGSSPAVPLTIGCASGASPQSCGDGAIQGGEACETEGSNCNPNCTCSSGTISTTPVSANCLPPFLSNLTLICSRFVGFACLEGINGQFLSCSNRGPQFFDCPTGSVCNNFTVQKGNPCTLIGGKNVSIPGNTVVEGGEQCEVDGVNCLFESATCAQGFVPTIPRSSSCVTRNESDLARLCSNRTGFLCLSSSPHRFVQCQGNLSAVLVSCPSSGNSTGCSVNNFTAFNPCVVSSRRDCGNRRIDSGEQCDGGIGCSSNCSCSLGFNTTTPPSVNCTGNGQNATLQARALAREPKCGDGVVSGSEECEIGGIGCSACLCLSEMSPTMPPSKDCTPLSSRWWGWF